MPYFELLLAKTTGNETAVFCAELSVEVNCFAPFDPSTIDTGMVFF